jgi:hypothetical protein
VVVRLLLLALKLCASTNSETNYSLLSKVTYENIHATCAIKAPDLETVAGPGYETSEVEHNEIVS